jgi:hypothetical protein
MRSGVHGQRTACSSAASGLAQQVTHYRKQRGHLLAAGVVQASASLRVPGQQGAAVNAELTRLTLRHVTEHNSQPGCIHGFWITLSAVCCVLHRWNATQYEVLGVHVHQEFHIMQWLLLLCTLLSYICSSLEASGRQRHVVPRHVVLHHIIAAATACAQG